MKARVLGLIHDVQWKDPTGDLRNLLTGLLDEADADLIAEEAHALPTTVAQRLACRLNKPWLNVDMDDWQRHAAGISDELMKRRWEPILEGTGPEGVIFDYLSRADGIREDHWVSQIIRQTPRSVIVLCGVAHLSPFAAKLRRRGCQVDETNVCDLSWFTEQFGIIRICESADGKRWCEHRYPPGK